MGENMNRNQRNLLIKMQLGNIKNGGNSKRQKKNLNRELYAGINEIVLKWSKDDIKTAGKIICTQKSKTFDIYIKQLYPKSIDDLYTGYILSKKCTCQNLLLWYAIVINQNASKINKYVDLKDKYEINFIDGNYVEANSILEYIEDEICYSFWSIDNRLSLAEYQGGLEKNKEYLEKIISSNSDNIVKFAAEFQSFKAEKSINNRQYIHRIDNAFSGNDVDYYSFFKEKLLPIQDFQEDEIADILRLNMNASIIDMYNTFVKICMRILTCENSEYQDTVKDAFSEIVSVEDIVLRKMRLTSGLNENNFMLMSSDDIWLLKIAHMYTIGKYQIVIRKIEERFHDYSNCFEIYEYYIKSHVMLNQSINMCEDNSIRSQLIKVMYSAYLKNEKMEHAYFVLSKLVRLFSCSYFGTELAYFFADKFFIGVFPILKRGRIYSSGFWGVRMIELNVREKKNLLIKFNEIDTKNAAVNLFEHVYLDKELDNESEIDENRIRWYSLKKNIATNSKDSILKLEKWYDEIKNEHSLFSVYQKERIVIELYYLYINEMEFVKAETLLVKERVSNKYNALRLDLSCIFDVYFVKNKEWKSSICTPIATYLHNKDNFSAIYSATANFLRYNGVSKPTELFIEADEIGKDQFCYFLKNVCVKEVLDSLYNSFDTDEAVENERIEICKFLQVYDKGNAGEYIEEISQILQNRKIRQGVKYLEDVKIDINFDKIFDSYRDEFRDNYKRYKEIEKLNQEYATYDVISNRWLINVEEDQQTYTHAFLALKELHNDYRQEIAFGKFGLDPILGTRIRHGILQNQIRIAFENNNIIFASKSTEDRTYIPALIIDEIGEVLSPIERDVLELILSDFSRSVDDYIDKLVTDKIRIHIDEKNEQGVFDFSLSQESVHILMSITKNYTNENLLRECLDKIWISKIEDGLKTARELFENEVKSDFIALLKTLEEEINSKVVNVKVRTVVLDSISRARTEFQQSIVFIKEWFKLPEEQQMDNFNADYLLETCDYINRRVVSGFNEIDIKRKILVKSMLRGSTFSHMVDILIILFTNAFYHSGYIEKLEDLEVNFRMTEVENDLLIYMDNNLHNSINREELLNEINVINEKLQECISSGEFYNYEGKSGYIKICKILTYNLECKNNYLQFGLTNDKSKYYIQIQISNNIFI